MAYVFKGTDFSDPDYLTEPLQSAKCGTRRGYRQHQNDDEAPCDECNQANTDYMRDYYRTRAATRTEAA